ncbi:hypothetical protein MYCTH_2142698 [Thermothelomyces thermophilus ATCC 42464]|uniref:Nucleotide-diphospho-sugar transferase domain-containing protein n=1 Tax=Thermothelomyces thermophilus (strain ATCC 42464 / BCRC 31852 / DSM 1799) TaxID=573729 RepID=G2Q063_THET4|nr:uncharacterized protein MYCTH_2142698 [Thermothelomyces thermophilus ATCC 42464]AEO55737.1 hypothetical protein MYCTH_2142698 [Thermothelomyces thermophilus ATCC 42464]
MAVSRSMPCREEGVPIFQDHILVVYASLAHFLQQPYHQIAADDMENLRATPSLRQPYHFPPSRLARFIRRGRGPDRSGPGTFTGNASDSDGAFLAATCLYRVSITKPTLPYTHSLTQPPLPPNRDPRRKAGFDKPAADPFYQRYGKGPPALDDLPDAIRAIWAPLVLPITAPVFTTIDEETKHLPLPGELLHAKPLGKRICILDLDNLRLQRGWEHLLQPVTLVGEPSKLGRRSSARPSNADRAPHWAKVVFTHEMLKQYDIVVTVDSDTMFANPPVAMADDPVGYPNHDVRRRVNVHSGFIMAQAGELTQRLFKDRAECPSETRYPGCAVWKDRPFHEQSAFTSHVRYDLLDGYSIDSHPQLVRTIPRNEANGLSGGVRNLTLPEFDHNVMAATSLLAQAAFKQPGTVEDYEHGVGWSADPQWTASAGGLISPVPTAPPVILETKQVKPKKKIRCLVAFLGYLHEPR